MSSAPELSPQQIQLLVLTNQINLLGMLTSARADIESLRLIIGALILNSEALLNKTIEANRVKYAQELQKQHEQLELLRKAVSTMVQ
jgi:hypothetical protein